MAKLTPMKWNPNLMLKSDGVNDLFDKHFTENSKVLFILGKGFDVRMNNFYRLFKKHNESLSINSFLITIDEASLSSTQAIDDLVLKNYNDFIALSENDNVVEKPVKIWEEEGLLRRRVGDKNAADVIPSDILDGYTDILIDISALPRGVYFSIIGKLLSLIDHQNNIDVNLMVLVSENAKIDSLIRNEDPEEDLKYSFGFPGRIELDGEAERPLIWFPVLGEGKKSHLLKCFNDKIKANSSRLYEICPVLPFPSKDPRRSDSILVEYNEVLFDSFTIEPQNIMYSSEQNPFDIYMKLSAAINSYTKTLDILGGCNVAISSLSSKLLSIGIILTAFERKDIVGILNVNSRGYKVDDISNFVELNKSSENFVTWLSGLPYKT